MAIFNCYVSSPEGNNREAWKLLNIVRSIGIFFGSLQRGHKTPAITEIFHGDARGRCVLTRRIWGYTKHGMKILNVGK